MNMNVTGLLLLVLCISFGGAKTVGEDAVVLFECTLPTGTKCGPQAVTGWTKSLDYYVPTGSYTASTQSVFNTTTGEFKPPVGGWYKFCAYFRFKIGENSNDITLLKNGVVVVAFGNADTKDWRRSTGTCMLMELGATDTVTMTSDCDYIEEDTDWNYAKFTGHLIARNDSLL